MGGRGEARAPNGAGGDGWRRRATPHGEPVRRLWHAAHRAEHGHLLERHRQDSAHLSLRRVRRVPLGARVQAAARGPSGKTRANGLQMGADAAARTKRPRYEGVQLSAAACTARISALLEVQGG